MGGFFGWGSRLKIKIRTAGEKGSFINLFFISDVNSLRPFSFELTLAFSINEPGMRCKEMGGESCKKRDEWIFSYGALTLNLNLSSTLG